MRLSILGVVAVLFASACGSNSLSPSGASQFVGSWQNVNAQSGGVPQITIRSQDNVVYVHSWGACSPTLCDWGEVSATSMSGKLQAVYNFSFEVNTQTLTVANGQLVSIVQIHRTDGSGAGDLVLTDVFTKTP
jgi:Fe-S cluster biogenesis protein NfuA